jgi:hypothetical protein
VGLPIFGLGIEKMLCKMRVYIKPYTHFFSLYLLSPEEHQQIIGGRLNSEVSPKFGKVKNFK